MHNRILHKLAVLAIGAILAVTWTADSHADESSVYLYLQPYTWTEDAELGGFWQVKYQALGSIDLRTLPEMAQRDVADQCCAITASDRPLDFPDVTYVGTGVNSNISPDALVALESRLGIEISARRMDRIWSEILFDHSDPTGQVAHKPIIPDRNGVVRAIIAPGIDLFRDTLRAGDERFEIAMNVHRADYNIIRMRDISTARRIASTWITKYGYDIRTPQQMRDGVEPPSTIITDDFDRADQTGLGMSSEGWSWSSVADTMDIVSNEAVEQGASNHAERAEYNLSSDDMYAQVDNTNASDNGYTQGVYVRFDSASYTAYFGGHKFTLGGDRDKLYKFVSGTPTSLQHQNLGVRANANTYRVDVDGSDITLTRDAVSGVPYTDTSITGYVRCGIGSVNSNPAAKFNDFECEDFAPPPARHVNITID